jgi:hypothetical protein
MPACTQITVEEQVQDRSQLEVTDISAPNATVGETIQVTATVTNTVVEGNGETLVGDVVFTGAGEELTTTVEVSPSTRQDVTVDLVPRNTGGQEICAELI